MIALHRSFHESALIHGSASLGTATVVVLDSV
jgi:hypothetical protein